MNKKEIEKRVIEILADKLDTAPEKINSDTKFVEDLGMDSFMAVEFNFELRENFGIDIPQKQLGNLKTVRNIVDIIIALKNKHKN